MAENENLINESEQEKVNDGVDYIEALKEMKQNSVSRSDYDKVKAENKKLLDALVQGKEIDLPKPEDKVSINELRKKLFDKDAQMSNLEYVETAVKLRNALLDAGEQDPFLPWGEKVDITAEQQDKAAAVAQVFQDCIDFAEGDSGIFTAELQRRTSEAMPAYARANAKKR